MAKHYCQDRSDLDRSVINIRLPLEIREAKAVTIFPEKNKTQLFPLDLPPQSEHPPTFSDYGPPHRILI